MKTYSDFYQLLTFISQIIMIVFRQNYHGFSYGLKMIKYKKPLTNQIITSGYFEKQ